MKFTPYIQDIKFGGVVRHYFAMFFRNGINGLGGKGVFRGLDKTFRGVAGATVVGQLVRYCGCGGRKQPEPVVGRKNFHRY